MAATTRRESVTPSRRAMLAGMLGGLGAVAASAIGRVTSVQAANGDPVTVGNAFTGTANTSISTTSPTAWLGSSSATAADAVRGIANGTGEAWGVRGDSSSTGTGAAGVSGSATASTGSTFGVRARSFSSAGVGLLGEALANSGATVGVRGRSDSPAGTGVHAVGAKALVTDGRLFFSTSGVATIGAGATSKVVNPGELIGSSSFVLLTSKANLGTRSLWFTTNSANDTFTIHMSASRGTKTPVAWLLLK